MALTQISTGGVKDDAVTAGKIPANAVGSSEIAKPIDLADDEKIRLGTGNDLELYHNGSHSYQTNTTGNFYITNSGGSVHLKTGSFVVDNAAGSEAIINAAADGAVELYYNNSKKFETTAGGATITGNCSVDGLYLSDNDKAFFGTGNDLEIYHDGSDSIIKHDGTGTLKIQTGSSVEDLELQGGRDVFIRVGITDGEETAIRCIDNGAVELYYDNSKKLETTSTGVTVTGTVSDSLGDLRSIPENARGTTYTLVATDAGKCVTQTHSSGFTIDNSVFSSGDAVTMINGTGSDFTITQGSGVTLYNSADASTGNRTLASRGMATVWFQSASVGYISGAGLS